MPTIKPRVAVTLNPHTHEVIERMAHLQGRTRGAVIADLLDSVAPALARTVALLEAAANAPGQVKQGLRDVVEGVHQELLAVSGDAIKQLDWIIADAGGQGVNPHVVTRGSGSDHARGSADKKTSSKPAATRSPGVSTKSKVTGVKDGRGKRSI